MSVDSPVRKLAGLRNAPLAMGRLASAWWAISRALAVSEGQGEGECPETAMLEALSGLAGALAARLYCPDGHGRYALCAHWCWAPAGDEPLSLDLVPDLPLEAGGQGLLLCDSGVVLTLPFANPSAFALLPLPYRRGIVGVVVFACPAVPAVDALAREALLLAARQAGCHLAANQALAALREAEKFGDFHRRIAFAMHDIKGLSGQLALLADNAEQHGDNPDFRDDMVLTLRSAHARLDALLASLSQGETVAGDGVYPSAEVDIGTIADMLAYSLQDRHPVTVIARDACAIAGDGEALRQVLTHLVQNAIEASPAQNPVFIGISADGPWARIEIIDSGHGMSAEFLRERLFRPFETQKSGGFGIGAYEAREMVRAMGGRIDVESREGVGTRFVIRLPRVAQLAGGRSAA